MSLVRYIFLTILSSFVFIFSGLADAAGHEDRTRRDIELTLTYLPSDNFENTEFSFSFPHKLGTIKNFEISGNLKTKYFHTNSSFDFPDDLYVVGYYIRANGERQRIWLSAKSYSDRPFNSLDETVFDITAIHRFPRTDRSAFFLGLIYQSRRSFLKNIPLPVALYEYKSEHFSILAGIPLLNARLDINDTTSFHFSYLPVINVLASVKYTVNEKITVSAEYTSKLDTFLSAGRNDTDQKLFLERIKAGLRISRSFNDRLRINGFLGYLFGSRFYEGDSFNDSDHQESIDSCIMFSTGIRYFL
jgi:hypothetical protein